MLNKPSKGRATAASAALSLLFVLVYGACNWITSQRSDVGTWYCAWERFIPFVPLMIVPYMSIDLFFVAAPFLCQSEAELTTYARRVSLAIVAGFCFLLFPLRLAVPIPPTTGWTGSMFNVLRSFDQPHNLFPSLHITLRTILAALYAGHTRGMTRWASHLWFSLIGFSTLLTYQHHIADILGGFVLAAACFYLIPDEATRLPVSPTESHAMDEKPPKWFPSPLGGERARVRGRFGVVWAIPSPVNYRISARYVVGSAVAVGLAILGWPWTGILLWPALSLAMVAAGYAGLGPGIYRKANGRLSLGARLLLGPCLSGQYVSLLYYRRKCSPWNAVTSHLWLGTQLNQREARELVREGVTAVLDLTAEFAEAPCLLGLNYRNLPILDLTAPTRAQLWAAVAFITEQARSGVVYVHCKVGYSRTAAVVGAYLLASGLAATPAEATRLLRKARPSIVIRPEALAALKDFASEKILKDFHCNSETLGRK